MSTLEITLITILWIVLGLWISFKRNWYFVPPESNDSSWEQIPIWGNILFCPIALLIALCRQFIFNKWDNE